GGTRSSRSRPPAPRRRDRPNLRPGVVAWTQPSWIHPRQKDVVASRALDAPGAEIELTLEDARQDRRPRRIDRELLERLVAAPVAEVPEALHRQRPVGLPDQKVAGAA